ncbi:hypothetical protein A2U01_0116192, partial [Trifolium medium]|nr:hypothetical protein [Trifolium medium]
MTQYSTGSQLPLAHPHPHSKVVVSNVTRVFLALPLQANVEYYYHRLSRLMSFYGSQLVT